MFGVKFSGVTCKDDRMLDRWPLSDSTFETIAIIPKQTKAETAISLSGTEMHA
jgi:hypothetical protein